MTMSLSPSKYSWSYTIFTFINFLSLINDAHALSLPSLTSPKPPVNDVSTLASSKEEQGSRGGIPFIIERVIPTRKEDFRDISNMCIDVFFNKGSLNGGEDEKSNGKFNVLTPWKSVQLSYLRHMQYSDLRTRSFMGTSKNEMFIARRVYPASIDDGDDDVSLSDVIISSQNMSTPIFNTPVNDENDDVVVASSPRYYTSGDIIGFCEVTVRSFGMPLPNGADVTKIKALRPVIANLAVRPDARKAGVGSKLVDACEEIVRTPAFGGFDEIVLQVEEDNAAARTFYEKRDYEFVFKDPATYRYDTNGIFLRQVRSTKICMRKELGKGAEGIERSRENISGLGSRLKNFFMDAIG
eukprot:CAMPEP_0172518132 /NCGR_PEP_ID=MMETSP1066-20121228/290633_1 /TAXON_ID=671091 /ORGANISM="Coscinodiscus wailesii, Strain CCMP2513" /LENGTH=353 /DNA_ID=CAMNT_0013300459 /DNA_START=127 /DNA_END=1191 /DNA_ORIENTATION=-